MRRSLKIVLACLAAGVAAKQCINATVAVSISARNGAFDLDIPQTRLETTLFTQNFTRQGGNFTAAALTGYETIEGTYNISTQFCYPDSGLSSDATVQVLTHGLLFDKS